MNSIEDDLNARRGSSFDGSSPTFSKEQDYTNADGEVRRDAYGDNNSVPASRSLEETFDDTTGTQKAAGAVHKLLSNSATKAGSLGVLAGAALDGAGVPDAQFIGELALQYPEAAVGVAAVAAYNAADETGVQTTLSDVYDALTASETEFEDVAASEYVEQTRDILEDVNANIPVDMRTEDAIEPTEEDLEGFELYNSKDEIKSVEHV